MKEMVMETEKNHVDNYDKVLPVFKIGTIEQSKSIYPAADKAIAKASKTVAKHSMFIGGKERVKWIKHAYMLVGISNYYKYDFLPAIEMFQFIFKQYEKFPIKYDALYWLARTYNERGSFNESQNMIDLTESEIDKVKKKKRWQHYAVSADLAIKQENHNVAIGHVLNTIKHTKNRKFQTRLKFILAQLYERSGDKANANKYYNEVLRRNSPFEMEFNTRINRALVFDNQTAQSDDLKKELKKLSRDEKYSDFRDKIFYALGNIEFEEGKKDEAKNYFKKSIAASTVNNNQKGRSYLKLADMAFDDALYVQANTYFDSTVAFLKPTDEKYVYATLKKEVLNELVENLETIKREDSLQRIGKLSPNEQEAFINEIIEEKKAKEAAEKEAELERQKAITSTALANNAAANTPQGGNLWYFYNPTTLSFGFTDFQKKFGNRKLEDNWRRSNKQAIAKNIFEEGEEGGEVNDSSKSEYSKDFYLKNLPKKPEDFAKSDQKIMDAYFGLGFIYKEKLNEKQLAINNFEELLKRFPNTSYKLTAYYQLYKTYSEMGNGAKADYYKNKVCNEAPNSDYCRIILNPEIGATLKNDRQKMDALYESTYNAFLNMNYDSVITVANEVDKLYPGDALQPRFDYLRALAIGRSATVPEFQASLKDVVIKFPKHKVKEEAIAILDFISKLTGEEEEFNKKTGNNPAPKPVNVETQPQNIVSKDSAVAKTEPPPVFSYTADSLHYCMAVLYQKGNESGKFKSGLSTFNATYFSNEEISINSTVINTLNAVFVGGFKNAEKAMNYYNTITAKPELIESHTPNEYKLFVISENNFGKLVKNAKIEEYMQFFKQKYNVK